MKSRVLHQCYKHHIAKFTSSASTRLTIDERIVIHFTAFIEVGQLMVRILHDDDVPAAPVLRVGVMIDRIIS